MTGQAIDNPILNSPYEQPDRYYEINNGPTGVIRDGRRPSESFIPIALSRKGQSDAVQGEFDLLTGERTVRNRLINDLRRDVDRWRRGGHYDGATAISRKLLQHWADPERENRVLFCQREAAETAIFLTEVAGRKGMTDWRKRLEPENDSHNAGLPRVALKMATGSGKTVVMAMLIAWHTLNKMYSPRDARFTNRFLVVAPGITIRDRLRVLLPEDPDNYYDLRDLIPTDLRGGLEQARVAITNYHSFLLRDAKEVRGIARNTRLLLRGDRPDDPFRETPQAMVSRVLRNLGVTAKNQQQIVVLNDEAHHCYQDRPVSSGVKLTAEEQEANEEARVWFKGLQAVAKHAGIKQIYDLSATPFYLSGSGYNEGHIFPWTVSDFSLMDAIESGIVKVPRTPVDDDAAHPLVTYLRLWEFVGKSLPKRAARGVVDNWIPQPELEGALRSLYRSYERAFAHWESVLRHHGETPPVFIVVCPNTAVSKLVYEWIAGEEVVQDDEVVAHRPGNLELLSNVVDGRPLARPRTILIDSAQLESGGGIKADFKQAAGAEILAFKQEYRLRNPGADIEKIGDDELLREVMNTVGKRGKLGEQIRCVVSVSMLTEGWDANTVTHILGVRAFRSQLLCEQVVGRGLRRRSYAVNPETGHFEPEYANVYGIPFQFISSDKPLPDPMPPRPVIEVCATKGREHLGITFPKLDGYRVEIPDEPLVFDPEGLPTFVIGPNTVPRWVEMQGVVGASEHEGGDHRKYRKQEVAYALAKRVLDRWLNTGEDRRPWLFPELVQICAEWLDRCVTITPPYDLGYLMTITEAQVEASEKIWDAIVREQGDRRDRLRPMLNRFDPEGSTGEVCFPTRKAAVEAVKSEVSHVTLDGKDGNTWEQLLAAELELNDNVHSYVKNDHLGFIIPYVHKGRNHSYLPDFLVRLRQRDSEDVPRTLIIEVSGSRKSPGPTQAKAETARNSWCVAVNNHGGFGRWGYVEMTNPLEFKTRLADAIRQLYDNAPIIGDPDLLDLDIWRSARGA
ncbi:DEAD/DEAH box helicase family protein [Nocardia sp. CDC159]|uniref:DEAD/DEAH box helicase family protein n=1 Tax=Nocardia pulmonis TaxID=2951408 RepID=A0A9X2IUS5_9NOCA|nr:MULTISPECIES: DEAD/DEAH box helicase family protein [Nocardia]MCM6773167.1 DEAD/DEAH box helicase family protein [Nocardia pulmonis]MCM6785530.1 DEAD/DEAH box helicase family protein [Nocardia sp. CDC159]